MGALDEGGGLMLFVEFNTCLCRMSFRLFGHVACYIWGLDGGGGAGGGSDSPC